LTEREKGLNHYLLLLSRKKNDEKISHYPEKRVHVAEQPKGQRVIGFDLTDASRRKTRSPRPKEMDQREETEELS